MLPFIIGGVALVATGYGVAKLLEEESDSSKETDFKSSFPFHNLKCNNEDNTDSHVFGEHKCMEKYNKVKHKLFNTTLSELRVVLSEIHNLEKEVYLPQILSEVPQTEIFENISEELEEDFKKHTKILSDVKKYIDKNLDEIDALVINESNFENYSNDEKELVLHLMQLCKMVDTLMDLKVTYDNVTMSREVKRGFKKIKQFIA